MRPQRSVIFLVLAVLPTLAQVQKTHPFYSGYGVNAATGSVTDAHASWIVPRVSCNKNASQVLFWVGIDGLLSVTVEQIGIRVQCVGNGTPEYSAWFEFVPDGPMDIPLEHGVKPNDKISAKVHFDGKHFTLTLRDVNTGDFSGPIHEPPNFEAGQAERSSAECLTEAPHPTSGIPLADFSKVSFGQNNTGVANTCFATVGGHTKAIGEFPGLVKFTMINAYSEAVPSLLSTDKSSFSILQYAGMVLADKPVAYYRLGEVHAATVVDFSGKRHTGTYENGPVVGVNGLVLDAANTAVNFAVKGDVVIPDAADLNFVNHAFTIEAWVNGPYSSFAGERRIFDKGIAGGPGGYGLDLNSNVQRIFGCTNFDTFTHLQDNTTYHVVGVTDGAGHGSIYVNGRLAGSGAFSACQPYTGAAHIALDNNGSSHFEGIIDEVAIYNYALSAGRILAHYQRGTGH